MHIIWIGRSVNGNSECFLFLGALIFTRAPLRNCLLVNNQFIMPWFPPCAFYAPFLCLPFLFYTPTLSVSALSILLPPASVCPFYTLPPPVFTLTIDQGKTTFYKKYPCIHLSQIYFFILILMRFSTLTAEMEFCTLRHLKHWQNIRLNILLMNIFNWFHAVIF